MKQLQTNTAKVTDFASLKSDVISIQQTLEELTTKAVDSHRFQCCLYSSLKHFAEGQTVTLLK